MKPNKIKEEAKISPHTNTHTHIKRKFFHSKLDGLLSNKSADESN